MAIRAPELPLSYKPPPGQPNDNIISSGEPSLLLAKMSYRYPHEDDSDENGFGESLQQSSGAQPHDSTDSDNDVFEPATEVTEDDQDEEDDDSDYEDEDEDGEDEFHGQ